MVFLVFHLSIIIWVKAFLGAEWSFICLIRKRRRKYFFEKSKNTGNVR